MTGSDHRPPRPAWLAPLDAPAEQLPTPTAERWQPLRLGLVDLYYYDDEQFWFHDGRLLLRGNNGTGKSKVLALTFPFLLDGSIQPRRVEPDADPKKRMEWNLLLGGAHPNTERTGYSWAEFGRVDADGAMHFVTLGIGLKAAAGRGIVKSWYFTTTRRIGELRLLDADRVALTQERLRAELEADGRGRVHTTVAAYRRAVDEALFRLGEERYGGLIDLLIQLRQPQLSKRPDEKALSAALSEALAPLDQAVVADVAESFRSLQEERAAIVDVRETLAAADGFLRHYRAYAKVAARRHTTRVRTANSTFEHAGRDLRETEDQLTAAIAEGEHVAAALGRADEARGILTGRQQALRESPEMRDAERLDQAARAASDLEQQAADATTEAGRSRERAQRDAVQATQAVQQHETAEATARQNDAAAVRSAEVAGLATEHPTLAGDSDAARRAVDRRREQVRHVRRLLGAGEAARQRADQQHRALDAAEGTAVARAEVLQGSREEVSRAVESYRETLADYLAGLVAVVGVEVGVLLERSGEWATTLDGDAPAQRAVAAAAQAVLADLGRRLAATGLEVDALESQRTDLRGRIAELEAGRDPEPPTVPGRDPDRRATSACAPLWRLTDFAESVPSEQRAGIEAALQSAGLLDASVFADGTVTVDGDVVLSAAGPPLATDLALGAVLVASAAPEAAVPSKVVVGVLARIGLGEGSGAALWLDVDGRWGAGPARGAWTKERAEFVGAGAREMARRALLARLRVESADVQSALAELRVNVHEIESSMRQVDAERDRYPSARERDLVAAHARVAAAEQELNRAQAEVERAHGEWEQAETAARLAAAALDEAATELDLGATEDSLEGTLTAISAYAVALLELRHSVGSAEQTRAAREAADERAGESAAMRDTREATARELRTSAATRRAHADALQETVGASVAQLQAKLGRLAEQLDEMGDQIKQLMRKQLEVTADHARLTERAVDLTARREAAALARAGVIEALRSFTETGLLRVAVPDLDAPDPGSAEEWQVTAALSLSRAAEQQLEAVDESDESWSRAQQRASSAHTDLSAQMSRHGHTAVLEQHGDAMLVRVRYRGDEVDIDRLADRLTDDLADRERLLSAREREILENHLVNEVAGHLHELMLSAHEPDRPDERGAGRPQDLHRHAAAGALAPGTDGPTGLAAARDLMLRSDATPGRRTTAPPSAASCRPRIADIRQADPTGSWQEHLERALDYRQWHVFAVERRQNGQWRPASGPASGGERVLAMSVPLFAAASSHYDSAAPARPAADPARRGVRGRRRRLPGQVARPARRPSTSTS